MAMKKLIAALAATLVLLAATPSQAAGFSFNFLPSLITGKPSVVAEVSIAKQRMVLTVTDKSGFAKTYVWKVSTGARGYATPTGAWNPTWLSIDHRSKTYDNAPMPFAVFFTGGYAVHATDAVAKLGQPASHGCVRLAKANAAMFFDLVKTYGKSNTKIIVTK
jgi:lipoprotein-anchoring transpeptidase ErfK/SrfK